MPIEWVLEVRQRRGKCEVSKGEGWNVVGIQRSLLHKFVINKAMSPAALSTRRAGIAICNRQARGHGGAMAIRKVRIQGTYDGCEDDMSRGCVLDQGCRDFRKGLCLVVAAVNSSFKCGSQTIRSEGGKKRGSLGESVASRPRPGVGWR
jgi:hypothetical protein